jgi:2-aminoadipate transaminase
MEKQVLTQLLSRESLCSQPSIIRELTALVDKPEIKSLGGGWPSPEYFPIDEVKKIFNEMIQSHGEKMLQYGPTNGFKELRTQICKMMKKQGHDTVDPEEILITHGSCQGMNLCVQLFVNPGDTIIVENPTYIGGIGAIQLKGGKITGVPMDEDGLRIDALEAVLKQADQDHSPVKGIYVIPNFQNPTGVTLSLSRRRKLIEMAETYNLVIFEDDPYCELRYEGQALPSLKQLDPYGRVIHLRSFSKTFNPGMRLGWICADRRIIQHMVTAKQFIDINTNCLSQLILLGFIRKGLLEQQIQKNIARYRQKRDFMLEQLALHFPDEVEWSRPSGGFFIFVRLPESMNAEHLFYKGLEHNIAFINARSFFVDGTGHNTIRLSFSQADENVIQIVIKKIADLIKTHLSDNKP